MQLNKAVSYTLLGKFIRIFGMLAVLAIYGRYISPEEIGVFAVIFIAYQFFVPLLEGGLTNSFLKSDANTQFLGKLHLLNLLLALLICSILVISRSFIEDIFEADISLFPLMIFCLFIVVSSLNVQRRGYFEKFKEFDTIFFVELFGFVVGSVISITMAIYNFGYLAIIARYLFEALFVLCCYRLWFGLKISFNLKKPNVKEYNLIKYGFKIAASRLLEGLTFSIDRIIVGISYGASQLGFYLYSKNLASMPDQIIRQAITHPLFSFLSELGYEDSYKELQKVTVAICIIVIPMIAMVVCFGDLMLELLMGPLWSEFGRNFQILGVFGMSLSLRGCLSILYITNMNMKSWNRFVFAELALLVIVFSIFIIIGLKIEEFIVMVAMYFFVFWSLVYLWKNMTELHLNQSLSLKNILYSNQLLFVFACLVFIGFFVRFVSWNFLPDSILWSFIIEFSLTLSVMIIYLACFYYFVKPDVLKTGYAWMKSNVLDRLD